MILTDFFFHHCFSLTEAHSVRIRGSAHHHCQLRCVGVGRAPAMQRQDHLGSEIGEYRFVLVRLTNWEKYRVTAGNVN